MARVSYNGFTPAERQRVYEWMKQIGWPQRLIPSVGDRCDACGSTDRVAAHNEDYSRPHTFWSLCRTCHSWVHRRFSDGPGFIRYRRAVMRHRPDSVLGELRMTRIAVDRADFPPLRNMSHST